MAFIGQDKWRPKLGLVWKVKAGGHYAHYNVGRVIQRNSFPHDGRIRPKAPLPKRMAQDHDFFVPRFLIIGTKYRADGRPGSEQRK